MVAHYLSVRERLRLIMKTITIIINDNRDKKKKKKNKKKKQREGLVIKEMEEYFRKMKEEGSII